MEDLVVIGAGPAGLSAAVYASRAGVNVLVLDSGAPGGKVNLTAEVENYPGIKHITGPDLAYQLYEHAMAFGAKIGYGEVTDIVDKGDHKEVICGDTVYETKAVIIASGTVERKIGLPLEQELTGKGVSYCAVCDAMFFKGVEVAVVGGGNSALEEAEYLTKFASKVHMIVRRDVFRGDKIIQDKVMNNEKIEVHFLKKPHAIIEKDNKVAGIEVIDSNTDEVSTIEVSGIFPFIGLDPVSGFAKNLGVLNDKGYLVVNEKMETKIPGIYGAGDVCEKDLRQIVTAANDGAIAGQEVSAFLSK